MNARQLYFHVAHALNTAPPEVAAHPGSAAFLRHVAEHYPNVRAQVSRRQLVAIAERINTTPAAPSRWLRPDYSAGAS